MKTKKSEDYQFKFEHLCEYRNQPKNKLVYKTTAVTLSEVLLCFEDFLRGSGFHFSGRLEIVEEDD